MDSVVLSALDEICCEAANGLHLSDLWAKLSPSLAARGMPICPNVKRAVWENLVEIPGLKAVADYGVASAKSTEDFIKFTVEECENMDVKIVAPEAMRKSFLGIYEMESSESSLSDTQRRILERLAVARDNGVAQNELTKEFRIPANNLFYQFKKLETQGLIVRHQSVIRKNKASNNKEQKSGSIVTTNMLYLYRYGKHLGSQQRLEITKEDQIFMDSEVAGGHTETGNDFGKETATDNVHVKDFIPALKAICDKLEKAEGKVLVVSDIKRGLGYRMTSGHRAWRNICHKLKEARVVEECCTMINNKEINCLRLLRSFSPSHFEPKLRGRGHDENDMDQSLSLKRGQITEELVELPILRQVYDMIDAAGTKGLTNIEVCKRLGLCSKEYHKRFFKQMISRFGVHLQLESHNKTEVYRVWTAGNFNLKSSNIPPIEREAALRESDMSKSLVADSRYAENLSQPKQVLDAYVSEGNNKDNNKSEYDAAVTTEASKGSTLDVEGTSNLLLQCIPLNSDLEQCNEAGITEASKCTTLEDEGSAECNTQNSDVEQCSVVLAEELLHGNEPVTSSNVLETCCLALTTPSRRRSHTKHPRVSIGAASSLREQHILKMLEEEKFLIKPELHRRLENLEKEKNTVMDRKTLIRSLNKLQQEGHCKCIHVSVPNVTNCGRSRTTEVVLHPSVYNVSEELLGQIHDKMRSFETQVRKHSYIREKKSQSVPILDNVQRIPNTARLKGQPEYADAMRANGFVLAKMVRTRLLHIFLWDWICCSPGWDDSLLSSNHSSDLKNPHSCCKSFELELATRSMPLELFLKVVGSEQKLEDMNKEPNSGLLLRDLPSEKYKGLMNTRATGRLSWLIDILRRLKLIRLVSKGHGEDESSSPHTTLTHALELKPYIEEPVSIAASSGYIFPDLRPQVRHDFVLSSRKAVDEYWNTLEYCYAAAKSKAALLAFPGSAVHEVFHPRSWVSARVMTASQRVELLKRVAKDGTKKRLSFSECEKIAEDLNLTLEQVLHVYYDQRQRSLARLQRVLNAEGEDLQTVKEKQTLSSRKRKRVSDRMSSKLAIVSVADGQSSLEVANPFLDSYNQSTLEQGSFLTTGEDYDCQLERNSAGNSEDGSDVKLNEEDKEVHKFIHKQALSRLNPARQKKFLWTEEADRQLVIEYATHRAALGAKFHRADWVSMSNLPAPHNSCKRRMAILNKHTPFREAIMKLCSILSEQYAKYLEKFQGMILNHRVSGGMVRDPEFTENRLYSSAAMPGNWANFDENIIKEALDDVLRCKRMGKIEGVRDTFSDQEYSEDDDVDDCGGKKASGQRSSSKRLPRKKLKLMSKGTNVSRQMRESVAIANAAELFKLIFLSNSTAPEVPTLLAETLRRYSEHDLFAAFNYLREKKIMIGGSSKQFVLSQHFLQSISSSAFPSDTGERAAKFAIWLHEGEKELIEEGIEVPSDLQCGEVFSLSALLSSGELSITPCVPNEGVGEAEDNRTAKRKFDDSELDGGESSKKFKTTFAGEGEMICRREKGFPGIKLCLHRETISRSLAIDSFKYGNMYLVPFFGDDLSGLNVKCGPSHSNVTDYVREILDSVTTNHPALDVSESPWEAMTSYAEYLMSSCSYEVKTSLLRPHLFKTLYSAIQKSGDNGLSMKEIRKVLNIKDEKMLEVMFEVLEAFGRALKVNAYDSVHVVDSLYRSKYFLTSVHDCAGHHLKGQKRKFEDERMPLNPLNHDDHRENFATSEDEINTNASEVHRITILNRPEDVADPPTESSAEDNIPRHQHSEVAPPKMNRVETLELHSNDAQICRPLLPWMNGDGTINELVYKRLIRRLLGIVMLNPGILENGIINQMQGLNPQSTRQLLEIMIMDNHIISRKLQQMTSAQPPSILRNLLGDRSNKSKFITRAHYFANPTSTDFL
ncbi:hypothetical protein ACS0TY_036253 [Phlomoides rotata]